MIGTNTVEGYYSIFKRGMKGIYQHCGEKHLHRYLAEFDFRYSNRVALGVDWRACDPRPKRRCRQAVDVPLASRHRSRVNSSVAWKKGWRKVCNWNSFLRIAKSDSHTMG
jgi:hypothetical protein